MTRRLTEWRRVIKLIPPRSPAYEECTFHYRRVVYPFPSYRANYAGDMGMRSLQDMGENQ